MAGSLFDQLKKSGLVDEKKAKKAKKEKYQKSKQQKGKKAVAQPDDAVNIAAKQAQQQKVERDRQLNLQRQQQQGVKAQKAALHQLIKSNKLSDFDGDADYNFVDNNKVKMLHLNQDTYKLLVSGRLRVVRFSGSYALIPQAAAEKVVVLNADALIPLTGKDDSVAEEDKDHYAQFEVPDDLTW